MSFLQQTNNVAISNRKKFCARQWVLCVRCPGSIEAVWSICPCIDQKEALLAKVYPWRQHHPGLRRLGGWIFQCKEGCVEWGSLSSLCDEGTRLHNVDNVYLWDECNSWRREVTEFLHMVHFWMSYGRCTMPGSPMGRSDGLPRRWTG